MSESNLGTLIQKIADANALEAEMINAVIEHTIKLDEIPETMVTTNVAIAAMLVDEKNYFNIPLLLRTREMTLLMAQLSGVMYRDLEGSRQLPIEIHAWVSGTLSTPILNHFPVQARSMEFCTRAVRISSKNVQYVPEKLLSDQVYIQSLIEMDASVLKYLKQEQITEELCEIAFKHPMFDLEYVPITMRSEDLCLRAFKQKYTAIFAIPPKYMTLKMVLKAIDLSKIEELKSIVEITPDEFKVYDFWLALAIKDSSTLRLVPEHLIDEHFAFKITKTVSKASHLKYIPVEVLTNPTISNALIENNPLLLEGIPPQSRDYMLCMAAVERNGMALQFVPNKMHDTKLYMTAITQNALAIKHVPIPYIDDNLPRMAISKNGEAIEFVKESYVDEDMCRTAIENNARAIYFIPEKFRNSYEMNLLAIKTDGSDLAIINERYRTIEVCRIAFRSNYKNWKYIPSDKRTDAEIISLYNHYSKQGFLKE